MSPTPNRLLGAEDCLNGPRRRPGRPSRLGLHDRGGRLDLYGRDCVDIVRAAYLADDPGEKIPMQPEFKIRVAQPSINDDDINQVISALKDDSMDVLKIFKDFVVYLDKAGKKPTSLNPEFFPERFELNDDFQAKLEQI